MCTFDLRWNLLHDVDKSSALDWNNRTGHRKDHYMARETINSGYLTVCARDKSSIWSIVIVDCIMNIVMRMPWCYRGTAGLAVVCRVTLLKKRRSLYYSQRTYYDTHVYGINGEYNSDTLLDSKLDAAIHNYFPPRRLMTKTSTITTPTTTTDLRFILYSKNNNNYKTKRIGNINVLWKYNFKSSTINSAGFSLQWFTHKRLPQIL